MPDLDRDVSVTADEIEAGTVLATGVSSVVLSEREDGDLDVDGHTLLLDLDDVDPLQAYQLLGRFDGVSALLRSSSGSWHLWQLSVRPLDDQLLTALRTPAEALHVQQSAKRGRFILRTSPKWRVDDEGRPTERYKEAPEVSEVVHQRSDDPQSLPHLQLLDQLADDPIGVEPRDVDDLVGERLVRSDYLTLDDGTKRRV
jgi:hypothetical protein